jgi:hypothetical protein
MSKKRHIRGTCREQWPGRLDCSDVESDESLAARPAQPFARPEDDERLRAEERRTAYAREREYFARRGEQS